MYLPMRHEDVTTRQSRDHYASLAQRTPELPDTLDELISTLNTRGPNPDHRVRNAAIRALLLAIRTDQLERPSIQLWLLWAFRSLVKSLAMKFENRTRKADDVAHDATWCLLEVLHSVGTQSDFLPRVIARDTGKLLRRLYGLEAETVIPEHVGLEDLLENGWDMPAAEVQTLIKDLQLPAADEDLLSGQFLYGFSPAELAEQLGITPAALRQRTHRILARLRKKS